MSSQSCVLVLGGAGYIGAHMVKTLLRHGEQVVVVDNLHNGRAEAVQTPHFIQGDIGDARLLDRVFGEYPISEVMHFAAFIEVAESVQRPLDFLDNNVRKTQTVLDRMARHDVRRLVFSSTAAVYGLCEGADNIREDAPLQPINPYGVSKLLAEQMIAAYGRIFDLRHIAFRYFNAAGADPDGDLGECHEPETHLIPLVLQAASGRRPSISIHGTDYPTPDGTCIRDYVHVTDLCEAHYLGLQALRAGAAPAAYNLGSEHGYSVREVIQMARRVTGRSIPVIEGARRPGDSVRLVADSRAAREGLGWRPRYSSLEDIVQHAWRWECRSLPDQEVSAAVRSQTSSDAASA